jgi:hypothetical protein
MGDHAISATLSIEKLKSRETIMTQDLNEKALVVKPLPVEQWDKSLAHIAAAMKGNPINVHKLMANHPELLKAWWNFRNYSVVGGDLGKRKGELVILRIGLHMKAWYEWGSHVERSLACGLSMVEIERVKQGAQAPEWAVDEALILIAVDELITTYSIRPETHKALRKYFSLKQVMDIIAIHGMYVILGCMINTWGLELDEHVQARLPQGCSREAFEQEYPRP